MDLLFNICNIYIHIFDTSKVQGGGDLQLGGGWYPLACSLSCFYTKCQYMHSIHKMYTCVCMHVCLAPFRALDCLNPAVSVSNYYTLHVLEKWFPLQGERGHSSYFWSFQKHNREEGGRNKNNRLINLPKVITFSTDYIYKYTT